MSMQAWRIRIQNRAGTTTYASATEFIEFRFSERLNRVGSFSFTVPVDGTFSAACQTNRYVVLDDTDASQEYFYGIIHKVKHSVDSQDTRILTVEGACVLHELTQERVDDLTVFEWGWASPTYAARVSDGASIANLTDGDTGTGWTPPGGNLFHTDYFYTGHSQPFTRVKYTIQSATATDGGPGAAIVQAFYQGEFWAEVSGLVDGTASGGDTFMQTGEITFDDITGVQLKENHNGFLLHWIRHYFNPSGYLTNFEMREVEIYTRVPTTSCLSPVIAYANGWSLGTVTTTTRGALQQFYNDTVLQAYTLIAEQSGGFFYRSSGRTLEWLNGTPTAYTTLNGASVTTTLDLTDFANYSTGTGNAIIDSLTQEEVAVEATRLHVTGAGMGEALIDMSLADTSLVSLPSGWTFSAADSMVINGNEETSLGYSIEKEFQMKNASAVGTSGNSPQVATMLLQAAIEELAVISNASRKRYNITAAAVRKPLKPGNYVNLDYTATRSSSDVWTVSEDVIVTEYDASIDTDGRIKYTLMVSNVEEFGTTSAAKLGKKLNTAEISSRHKQVLKPEDIDGSIGSTGGVSGTIDSDAYITPADLADHTNDPDAHHDRQHDITDSNDHSSTGTAGQILYAPADTTLGWLTPVSDGDATKDTVLKTSAGGLLKVTQLDASDTQLQSGSSRLGPASANLTVTHGGTDVDISTDSTDNVTIDFDASVATGEVLAHFRNTNANVGVSIRAAGASGSALTLGGLDSRDHAVVGNDWTSAAYDTPLMLYGHDGVKLVDDSGLVFDSRNSSEVELGRDFLPATTDTYNLGSLSKKWLNVYGSELHVEVFALDETILTGGRVVIPHLVGLFPSAIGASDTTIDFGSYSVSNGDFVEIRGINGGSPQVEYIQVGTLDSGTTYNVTRNLDGSGANSWPAEQPFHVMGQSANADGWIELNAQSGSTPRISLLTTGGTYNGETEKIRIGNLNGLGGVSSDVMGLYAGDGADQYMLYRSDTDALVLSGEIKAQSGSFDGIVEIGTSGALRQGLGTYPGSFTGLSIENSGGVGRMITYNSGTRQIEINTNGQLVAGSSDDLVIDENGIVFDALSGSLLHSKSPSNITWDYLGNQIAGLSAYNLISGSIGAYAEWGSAYNGTTNEASIVLYSPSTLPEIGGNITLTGNTITTAGTLALGGDVSGSGRTITITDLNVLDDIVIDGDLKVGRGGVDYTGYIYVPFTTPYTLISTTYSTTAATSVSLVGSGVPSDAKAVVCDIRAEDGQTGTNKVAGLGPSATYWYQLVAFTHGGGERGRAYGAVSIQTASTIYIRVTANGTNSNDVEVNVWGYYI